jgi:hypothetical protein
MIETGNEPGPAETWPLLDSPPPAVVRAAQAGAAVPPPASNTPAPGAATPPADNGPPLVANAPLPRVDRAPDGAAIVPHNEQIAATGVGVSKVVSPESSLSP